MVLAHIVVVTFDLAADVVCWIGFHPWKSCSLGWVLFLEALFIYWHCPRMKKLIVLVVKHDFGTMRVALHCIALFCCYPWKSCSLDWHCPHLKQFIILIVKHDSGVTRIVFHCVVLFTPLEVLFVGLASSTHEIIHYSYC